MSSKLKIVAYEMSASSNDTFMFPTNEPTELFCKACGYRLDFLSPTALNPNYAFKKKFRPVYTGTNETITIKDPLKYTWDWCAIASDAMKGIAESMVCKDIEYGALPNSPHRFVMMPTRELPMNLEVSRVEMSNRCPVCCHFDTCAYRGDLVVDVSAAPPDGFHRTDIAFGSGNSKHSVIIVGIETWKKRKVLKLKRIGISPVYGSYWVIQVGAIELNCPTLRMTATACQPARRVRRAKQPIPTMSVLATIK